MQIEKSQKLGGEVAKTARDDLEEKLGESIISKENNLNYKYLEDNKFLENSSEDKVKSKKLLKK